MAPSEYPCAEQMPEIQKVQKQRTSAAVHMLAIDGDRIVSILLRTGSVCSGARATYKCLSGARVVHWRGIVSRHGGFACAKNRWIALANQLIVIRTGKIE